MSIDTDATDHVPRPRAEPTIEEGAAKRLSLGSRMAFALARRIRIGSFDVRVPEGASAALYRPARRARSASSTSVIPAWRDG